MKPINILVVEDERVAAQTLVFNLKQYNYQVVGIVDSGIKAIKKVAETKTEINLILMDIVLKGPIDGITTSQIIHFYNKIPIIYLSSCAEQNILKRARKTKPKGYLIKPYDIEDLVATIESSFEHQDYLQSSLKQINNKVQLATLKVKQIAHQNLKVPSLSDRDRQIKRERYRDRLPKLSPEDARIVSTLQQDGVYMTSLQELKLTYTKRLVKQLKILHPHLYTLSNQHDWREGIPRSRKFLHTEILFWALGERLLNIVENYIGLPLLFHGVDLRRDAADATITDARQWHRDIDDERMVKVIIYLNNVGHTGGPFEYIPRAFTEHLTNTLDYKSGFINDKAISKIVSSQNWQPCTAKAGSIIITDPCNVFHRAKPAKRNRYSITFGYTSRIPKLSLSEFQLFRAEWNRITPLLSKRQIACLRRSK